MTVVSTALNASISKDLLELQGMAGRAYEYMDGNPTSKPFFNAHYHRKMTIWIQNYEYAVRLIEEHDFSGPDNGLTTHVGSLRMSAGRA